MIVTTRAIVMLSRCAAFGDCICVLTSDLSEAEDKVRQVFHA